METKIFEIRDDATFMPVVAIRPGNKYASQYSEPTNIRTSARENELWGRAGYGSTPWEEYIILMPLSDLRRTSYDSMITSNGGNRTLYTVHEWLKIAENWNSVETGALIDVRVLLGERSAPCETELRTPNPLGG